MSFAYLNKAVAQVARHGATYRITMIRAATCIACCHSGRDIISLHDIDMDYHGEGRRLSTTQRDARWIASSLVAGAPVRVSEPALIELVRCMRSVSIPAGTLLYRADGSVTCIWILRSGRVEISRGTGRNRCVLSILRAGDVVGDTYLLLHTPPPFTARCTDESLCWVLEADLFRALIARHPAIAVAWSCNLAQRVCRSEQRIVETLDGSLSQRLARVLLSEAQANEVRVPQVTIAQMLGVQRTSINKLLKRFERDGLVELGYGAVFLRNPHCMWAIAHGAPDPRFQARGSRADRSG